MQHVTVGSSGVSPVIFGGGALGIICGPCVIESREHAIEHADAISQIAKKLALPIIFKSSYDKANRTSAAGFRGVGIESGLAILSEIRTKFSIPVLTDVHSPEDAKRAGAVVDVLQIPAFLCRQTDLLIAAGETGKAVNIKKGQFLHPDDMRFAAEKVRSTGNGNVLLCERGSCFGYRELVVDYRGLVTMRESRCPVIFDATHSVQRMGGAGGSSGGDRRFVAPLARAAVAVGVDGVFLEAHRDPDRAPSDGPNMVAISDLSSLLESLVAIHKSR